MVIPKSVASDDVRGICVNEGPGRLFALLGIVRPFVVVLEVRLSVLMIVETLVVTIVSMYWVANVTTVVLVTTTVVVVA